jgi:hypothetical protein
MNSAPAATTAGGLPAATASPKHPPTPRPVGAAWDEAFLRVESYLRAHQIESRLLLNRLVMEIVLAAAAKAVTTPATDPLALSMAEAERRTTTWFARVLGDAADPSDEHLGARGRIALVMADVPARWPQHFLAEGAPPTELITAMRAAYIEAGPEMEITRMVPRELDFGPIANAADETWKTFRRWPLLRAALGWALILALLALGWFYAHPFF